MEHHGKASRRCTAAGGGRQTGGSRHAALSSEHVRTHFEKVGTRPMVLKAEMIPFIEEAIARWRDVIERPGLEKQ